MHNTLEDCLSCPESSDRDWVLYALPVDNDFKLVSPARFGDSLIPLCKDGMVPVITRAEFERYYANSWEEISPLDKIICMVEIMDNARINIAYAVSRSLM